MPDEKNTRWWNQPWTGAAAVIALPLLGLIVLIGGLPSRMTKVEEKLDRLTESVSVIRGELQERRATLTGTPGDGPLADARSCSN